MLVQVRNLLGSLGLEVTRLIRTDYGPLHLDDLPVGATEVPLPIE